MCELESLSDTEREAIVLARIGQGPFREDLLEPTDTKYFVQKSRLRDRCSRSGYDNIHAGLSLMEEIMADQDRSSDRGGMSSQRNSQSEPDKQPIGDNDRDNRDRDNDRETMPGRRPNEQGEPDRGEPDREKSDLELEDDMDQRDPDLAQGDRGEL